MSLSTIHRHGIPRFFERIFLRLPISWKKVLMKIYVHIYLRNVVQNDFVDLYNVELSMLQNYKSFRIETCNIPEPLKLFTSNLVIYFFFIRRQLQVKMKNANMCEHFYILLKSILLNAIKLEFDRIVSQGRVRALTDDFVTCIS